MAKSKKKNRAGVKPMPKELYVMFEGDIPIAYLSPSEMRIHMMDDGWESETVAVFKFDRMARVTASITVE